MHMSNNERTLCFCTALCLVWARNAPCMVLEKIRAFSLSIMKIKHKMITKHHSFPLKRIHLTINDINIHFNIFVGIILKPGEKRRKDDQSPLQGQACTLTCWAQGRGCEHSYYGQTHSVLLGVAAFFLFSKPREERSFAFLKKMPGIITVSSLEPWVQDKGDSFVTTRSPPPRLWLIGRF